MQRRIQIAAILFLLCATLTAVPRLVRAGETTPPGTPPVATQLARAADDTVDVQALDEQPKVIRMVAPKYPESARLRKQEGVVHLRARVTVKGQADRIAVVPGKSLAQDLDKAAIDAIRQWTFSPAKKDGKPVAVYIVIPVKFTLH